MKIYKWNKEEQKDIEVNLPELNFVANPSAVNDINQMAVCPYCLCNFRLGNGYTSRVLHTKLGFGYAICPSCHKNERKYLEEKKNDHN